MYANDLNPQAVKYLRLNDKRNNAKKGFHLAGTTCMDARECVALRVGEATAAARAAAAGAGAGAGAGEGAAVREDLLGGGWDCDRDGEGDGDEAVAGDVGRRRDQNNNQKRIQPPLRFTQAVMNLPQGSLGLLDCFVGVFDREVWPAEILPRINAYAFSKAEDPEGDVGAVAAAALGLEPDAAALGDGVTFRRVRLVAPGKYMILISFRLPAAAAYK